MKKIIPLFILPVMMFANSEPLPLDTLDKSGIEEISLNSQENTRAYFYGKVGAIPIAFTAGLGYRTHDIEQRTGWDFSGSGMCSPFDHSLLLFSLKAAPLSYKQPTLNSRYFELV